MRAAGVVASAAGALGAAVFVMFWENRVFTQVRKHALDAVCGSG
jgi:hypothetical protein